MAGGNLLRKAVPSLDCQEDCGVISSRQEGRKRRKGTHREMGRDPPQ